MHTELCTYTYLGTKCSLGLTNSRVDILSCITAGSAFNGGNFLCTFAAGWDFFLPPPRFFFFGRPGPTTVVGTTRREILGTFNLFMLSDMVIRAKTCVVGSSYTTCPCTPSCGLQPYSFTKLCLAMGFCVRRLLARFNTSTRRSHEVNLVAAQCVQYSSAISSPRVMMTLPKRFW